jgi:hypothetical protein
MGAGAAVEIMRIGRLRWLVLWALGASVRAALGADDPCTGFSWDVGQERALFATVAEAVPGGKDAASARLVVPKRLYEVSLIPQEQVKFEVPPGKKTRVDGASAGLARLQLTTAGEYRVSLDQPSWIDVVADHELIASKDFQGRPGCQTPHKLVLYLLPAGVNLILQFSGASTSRLRLIITSVPAASGR